MPPAPPGRYGHVAGASVRRQERTARHLRRIGRRLALRAPLAGAAGPKMGRVGLGGYDALAELNKGGDLDNEVAHRRGDHDQPVGVDLAAERHPRLEQVGRGLGHEARLAGEELGHVQALLVVRLVEGVVRDPLDHVDAPAPGGVG